MQKRIKFGWLIFACWLVLTASAPAVALIPLGSTWRYFLGVSEASSPTNTWRQIIYGDNAFSSGGAPIGYDTGGTPGTAPIVTVLPDPRTAGNPVWNSTYFRKVFTVADPSRVANLLLTIYIDDGCVAW